MDAQAKAGAQHQQAAHIGDALHGRAGVVHTQTVFGHHLAQSLGRGRLPIALCTLKKRQVMLGRNHRLRFVVHQHIDHTIAVLHGAGANLLGLEHAQAPAFDHGRAAHADVAVLRGDDHIAATQERRIARKATPGHHADHRHLAIEAGKGSEGREVESCHDGHVHIAGSATTAFGEQHHRQLVLQRNGQHAVGFLVVAHALRAGQHRRVVRHEHHALALDLADAGHHAVGRRVAHQVVGRAAAALRGHGQGTVFDEAARIAQVGDVLARRAQAQGMALGHGFGALRVLREGQARLQFLQIGADVRGTGGRTGGRTG